MMLITLHISGCITIISLIEYRILFYLTDFSNDINKTVMFPLLLFLFPFCFVLGILDTILHTILHYTCQLLEITCEGWGECFLLQIFLCFNIPSQGWGGGMFLIVFSFSCIKIILKYSAYQCCIPPMADQLSSCCTVIDVGSTFEIRGFS